MERKTSCGAPPLVVGAATGLRNFAETNDSTTSVKRSSAHGLPASAPVKAMWLGDCEDDDRGRSKHRDA